MQTFNQLVAFCLFLASCGTAAAPLGAGIDATGGGADVQGFETAATDGQTADSAGVADVAAKICLGKNESGECDTNSECGTGNYCDTCTKKCAPERLPCEPCESDNQCKEASNGSVCLTYSGGGNYCGLVCLGNAGCPAGFDCVKADGVEKMQCVPKTKSCGPKSGLCKLDTDCPYQSVCKVDYGTCVKGCTEDGNCVTGSVCSLGHCVPPCAKDGDCSTIADIAKCVDTHCKIPGGCVNSNECDTKETHCDMASHKCIAGCLQDGDCKDFSMTCQSGKCVKTGCSKNWQCAFNQVCDDTTGECKTAVGDYCKPCTDTDKAKDCGGGAPNLCIKMQDQNKVDKGSFCFLTCGSAASGPCPQGYGCTEIKDDKGASQGKFCQRQCWSKPFGVP